MLVGLAWKVGGVNLQGIPSKGSRDTGENVLCSPSKVPLFIARF
jgi:hypothetical protein